MNAIIGDNGIITNAQGAKMQSELKVLEEFLQEEYIKVYGENDSEKYQLDYMLKYRPQYFYIPKNEGFGALNYIEHEGKAIYLLKKSGLPNEISKNLSGGNAGEGRYVDYANLNDVYGINEDYKVYYCSSGLDSIIGLNKEDLDIAIDRVVCDANSVESGFGSALSNYDTSEDGEITLSEIKDIKTLELTKNVSLKDIYNLGNLESLIIKDVDGIDLSGIENLRKLNYIWMYKSKAINYEPIGKVGGRLVRLYFQYINDGEFSKFIDGIKNYDLPNLTYLGFWNTGNDSHGPQNYMSYFKMNNGSEFGQNSNGLTSVSRLSELTSATKTAIKYFYIEGNKLSNIDGICDLSNLLVLKMYYNDVTNLRGVNNLTKLEYLDIHRNKLFDVNGRLDSEKENDSLYWIAQCQSLILLDLCYNSDIRYIDYISGLPLRYLFLDGLTNLNTTSLASVSEKINSVDTKSFDRMYTLTLLDSTKTTSVDITSQTITVGDLISIGQCTNLTVLYMQNTKVVKGASETLSSDENTVEKLMQKAFTNIKKLTHLDIAGMKINLNGTEEKIKNLNFINTSLRSTIRWIDLRDTDVMVLGESASLNASDKTISVNNGTILNTITTLNTFIINTDKFNFYYLQDLVNRMNTGSRPVEYYNCGGLCCFNNVSLNTLGNCDRITSIVTYEYYGGINVENTLDLSNCNNLKSVHLFGWYSFVKLPSCIKSIGTTCTTTRFLF